MFPMNTVDGVFQHTVEAPQHNHRKHDQAVLRWPIRAAQALGNFPNFVCELLVLLNIQEASSQSANFLHVKRHFFLTDVQPDYALTFPFRPTGAVCALPTPVRACLPVCESSR